MKNKLLLFTLLFFIILVPVNTKALTSSDYAKRHICNNFELAGAHTDGSIAHVACYKTYEKAHNDMINNGADDLIILDERNDKTKIVDAVFALVDLMKQSVYFYQDSSLGNMYTAVTGLLGFGCADGAFIETNSSNFSHKVKLAGYTGWVSNNDIEIVPVNWLKSKSYYVVGNDYIEHIYTNEIQDYSSAGGRVFGPKPDMLNNGTYYSYDGIYFYTSINKMLSDYKNNNYNNSINKNKPYYNYYMNLPNHSKTTYSSINIDDYVRSLGYNKNIYSHKAYNGTSKLYGQGAFFYNTQQKYGVNAVLTFSLSKNETGNGRSDIVIFKNNGFGLDAVDSNPYEDADYFPTYASSIYEYASRWNTYGYSYPTDYRYYGSAFGNKLNGMQVKYATDAYWSEKMASNYYYLDKYYGFNDYNYYQLGIVNKQTKAYYRANTGKEMYTYPEAGDHLLIVGEEGNFYKVVSDLNMDSNGNPIGSKYNYNVAYNWNNNYVYVLKSDVKLINKGKNGYISPNSVTNYKDADYSYELFVEDASLKPRVAKLNKDSNYYNDSTLTQSASKKVLKDKLVMVYSATYDKNGNIVSYLITSDYAYNQKAWVSADSISFVNSDYGMQVVDARAYYEWVCSTKVSEEKYKISSLYSDTYFPIISEENGWYKVPVSLDSNNNSYGYVLINDDGAHVEKYNYKTSNNYPVITANDKK